MFISKQDIIREMSKDPSNMAKRYLDAHERIEQLVTKIDTLERALRNPRGRNTNNKTG